MKLQKTVGQFEPGGGKDAETWVDAPLHQIDQTAKARFAQQHYIPKAGLALRFRQFDGP